MARLNAWWRRYVGYFRLATGKMVDCGASLTSSARSPTIGRETQGAWLTRGIERDTYGSLAPSPDTPPFQECPSSTKMPMVVTRGRWHCCRSLGVSREQWRIIGVGRNAQGHEAMIISPFSGGRGGQVVPKHSSNKPGDAQNSAISRRFAWEPQC